MPEIAPSPARPDRRQCARTLSFLFLGGAGLGLTAVAFLPLPRGTNVPGISAVLLVSFVIGAALLAAAARVPGWVIPLGLAAGTVIVGCDIYFAGEIRTNDEMFYLWVAFYGFYFLPVRVALAELMWLAVTYGLVLAMRHEPESSTRWVITMGTLLVAGLLTSRLVGQLDRWVRRSMKREEELRQAEARFRSAFDDAAIGMALVGLDGRWQRANEALARLTGYPAATLVGMSFRDLTPQDEQGTDEAALKSLVSGETSTYHAEKRYVRADGTVAWIALNVSVVRDDQGQPLHLISQMQDVSARKEAERELAERALHDPLTGLPNRLLFADRVQVALSRIERSGAHLAVFFIDLDRFKLVNDSLGHAIGDKLLVEVADRLRRVVRPSDTVSRFGGDEFTLLCENTSEQAASLVAERILSSLSRPIVIDGHELFASASIGIAVGRDHRTRAEAMLRDADAAMYRAKDQGRSRFAIFDGGMHLRATARLELENDMRRALERDELRLLYQPVVVLSDNRIDGVETLLRWQHPRRGLLTPIQFIAIAEESGLIVPLGEWVIGQACRQARIWQGGGHSLRVSINLSPRQLADPQLSEVISGAISATGVDPALLCLEVTEAAAAEGELGALAGLRELGVGLALDDFGAGFSSLNQIRRLPSVDTLKIDRMFIEELGRRPTDTAIVAAIVGMARAMGMATVAEGIETEVQARVVRQLGCDRGQGYHFGHPVSPSSLGELIDSAELGELSA